jgi:hypothetical protein
MYTIDCFVFSRDDEIINIGEALSLKAIGPICNFFFDDLDDGCHVSLEINGC